MFIEHIRKLLFHASARPHSVKALKKKNFKILVPFLPLNIAFCHRIRIFFFFCHRINFDDSCSPVLHTAENSRAAASPGFLEKRLKAHSSQ